MFKNISIKMKLILSFSIIVILIVVLSLYSIYSTNESGNGFITYQNMTKESSLVGEIKSDMQKISMDVKDYLNHESQDDISFFNAHYNKTKALLLKSKKVIKDSKKLALVYQMEKKLEAYKKSFYEVVEYIKERDKIKNETLDVIGEDIEHLLKLVIKENQAQGKYSSATLVSTTLTEVVLARMYTYKFLNSFDKNDFHKVYEIFNNLTIELEGLQEKIVDPISFSRFNMSFKLILNYKNSAFSIYDVIIAKNKIINKKLNTVEKQILALSEKIETSIKKEQNTIGGVVKNLNTSIKSLVIIISSVIVIFSILISFLLSRHITNLIITFQTGLLHFFKYLNKETSQAQLLNLSGNNEIVHMARLVNKNIQKIEKALVEDQELLNNVQSVVDEVKDGKFTGQIEKNTGNESLEKLKNSFNDMLLNIRNDVCDDVNKILMVLDAYSKLDFTKKVDDSGKVSEGLNNVSQIITDMLVQNQSIGLTLDKSSNNLTKNVDTLNKLSNETAAALEETAAALEEITSTIINNSGNVAKMSTYADELTASAKDGQKMAQNTTSAMDDITEQVTLINDSITVIDQIAFQTNILSLNAAVEAATAAEAGKGFAVVAQEVRNLAARSAEAAKEIKDLVEKATLKAGHGKSISDEMIQGYDSLLENIDKSTNMIQEINHASKEQETGISQINDAVNSLDQQTQQNAQIANETQSIAIETDKIAKEIVEDASKKEFTGKRQI